MAPHSRKLSVELGESDRNEGGAGYTGGLEGGFQQEAEVLDMAGLGTWLRAQKPAPI